MCPSFKGKDAGDIANLWGLSTNISGDGQWEYPSDLYDLKL